MSTSIRTAEIEAYAEKVFVSSVMARKSMYQNNIALGCTPISMLNTEIGAAEVMKILESIANGWYRINILDWSAMNKLDVTEYRE